MMASDSMGAKALVARGACILALAVATSGLPGRALSAPTGQESALAQAKPSDVEQGRREFETNCSACHGLDAGGAMGPNIQGIPFRLGADVVSGIIRDGAGRGGMPAFAGQLSPAQIQRIIAYLLSLTPKDAGKVTGDPAKGKQVYGSSGCAACHMIAGQGGDLGPELTNVGALRGPGYLRNAVLYPGTDLPQEHSFLESGGRLDYLFVHAVTKSGQTVDGTRVAEDSFRIVIEDASGNFHSLQKSILRELKSEPGKSVMPSVRGKLSEAQVDDLTAYLASLKGTP